MASDEKEERFKKQLGLRYMFWFGYLCSICAFGSVFIAFASPYWYKSWSRVYSPLGNVGLWHICLSGWVKPKDPSLRSYVGCWWIHSSFFEEVWDDIMPPWFRAVQALVIFTLLCNLAVVFLLSFYPILECRRQFYRPRRFKAFLLNALLLFAAGVLVLIVSLVFALKARDANWMPRPRLNYLSWSFGFYVLSGFFSAFGGISLFVIAMLHGDDVRGDEDYVEKRVEIPLPPTTRKPHEMEYDGYEPSEHGTQSTVGAVSKHSESFV